MIDWVVSDQNEFKDLFDTSNIYVIGHSRGGGIVSLASAKDPRIKKAITWASVYNLTERLPGDTEEWKQDGVVYQTNGRTKQEMPLYFQFYENTMANKEILDVSKVAKRINTPFCIIHGREDAVVKEENAEELDSFISTSTLILIEGAGHTFGSSHPFLGDELPKQLNQVVEESLLFLKD